MRRADKTPTTINAGDRLTCRYDGGAPFVQEGRSYTVNRVYNNGNGRAVEVEELPDRLIPAWRFRAYDPARDRAA